MNNSGANRINITITPSSRPSTLDITNAQQWSHNSADRADSLNSPPTSSSSSSLDDGYDYSKRKKYGQHAQGLSASAIGTVDAVLDRNNHRTQPNTHIDLSDLENLGEDEEGDDEEASYRISKGVNNTSRGAMTQSHDLGQTAIIPPVEPHRQVKHPQPMNKSQQSRHLPLARSALRSPSQKSNPARHPGKTEITTSEAMSMTDALYPHGVPMPEFGQENTKPTRTTPEQPYAQPRPLSQEKIQMYRTATCMSELEGDAEIQYDDEKQPGYIPNWHLFLPDRETEQKIVKKLDWNLLPLLGILYLFSYLDRVNIGNARLFGLEEAMHLTDTQYNIALASFFVAYCIFEIPSNWILVRIGPRSWIPLLMLAWGSISLLMAWVTSFTGLTIIRFALGLAEAGFVPGVLYYITLFYKRSEQSFRIAIFLSFNILAGAFGGLLAAAISRLSGKLGLQGWQWIFVLEAIPTILLAVLTWFVMSPSPSTAKFLTTDERIYASNRILMESDVLPTANASWRQTREAMTDYRVWLICLSNMFLLMPSSGVVLFLPSLIKDMGFTATTAQLLTVPPYMLAAAFSLVVPWWSDRIRVRGFFLMTVPFIALAGFLVLAFAPWTWVRYSGVILALLGIVPSGPILASWLTNNCVGHTKRATALAMLVSTGSLASVAGTQVYRAPDRPRYQYGHLVMASSMALLIISAAIIRKILSKDNKRKERDLRDGTLGSAYIGSHNLERAPNFRYIL
ncbi:hypothetical protein BGZ59_011682 [Podila verticillata]|nr:hypothetical protein BGZ59_011682 [Podila verticillata]